MDAPLLQPAAAVHSAASAVPDCTLCSTAAVGEPPEVHGCTCTLAGAVEAASYGHSCALEDPVPCGQCSQVEGAPFIAKRSFSAGKATPLAEQHTTLTAVFSCQ